MNFYQRLLWYGSSLLLGGMILPITVSAQSVTSDGTLSTNVTTPDNRNFTITNGNQPNNGANLFHSFSQFSVPTGGSATFDLVNTPNISTIFSRVTGGNVSSIDGLIQTTNSSNPVSLFLLNPSGIILGANSRLNIGGSFVGTTASRIRFADGVEFSGVNPSVSPLLTVSAPSGLVFGQNSGAIAVQGLGHRLNGQLFVPLDRSNNPTGLQVGAGNSLVLIGNEVNFSGGIVATVGGGHLEVGSVREGQVNLVSNGQQWVGDYSTVRQFNNITLARQSLLDASGSNSSIQLQGKTINLNDGSTAAIQNFGTQPSGGITVRATDSLNLTGNTLDGKWASAIQIENLGAAKTGDIVISTDQLSLQNGGHIWNLTYTPAAGGNITVTANRQLNLDGFAPSAPAIQSIIVTNTVNAGNAGDITVSTGNLSGSNGGYITSLSFGSGRAGTIQVDARGSIDFAGLNPITRLPSGMSSTAAGDGRGSDLIVNTSRLVIRDGGGVAANTLSKGAAGSITINASESVEVSGRASGSTVPSRITSASEILDPVFQAAFGLPPIPTGDAGTLTINTPSLRITDGGSVTVRNDGPGRAGNLQINAKSIFLDNQGSITASTASGNGGDVRLNLQNLLLLRHNSLISATAAGAGNGGNLSVNAPILVGLENSDIIANAVQGAGGNIDITTQGLFGLKFRSQLTEESDITASSQFGLSGTVSINNLTFTPTAGLIQLPSNVDDPSQRIVQGCRTYGNSRFVATGRGGLPENPSDRRNSPHPWTDLRDPTAFRSTTNSTNVSQAETSTPPIVEATGWRINGKGEVDIYAANNVGIEMPRINCAGISIISSEPSKGGNIP